MKNVKKNYIRFIFFYEKKFLQKHFLCVNRKFKNKILSFIHKLLKYWGYLSF